MSKEEKNLQQNNTKYNISSYKKTAEEQKADAVNIATRQTAEYVKNERENVKENQEEMSM